jgi:hypothetical protein
VIGQLTDVSERRRAVEARRFLAKASEESLDEGYTLPRLARLPIPWLADYCLVDRVDGDQLRRVAGYGEGATFTFLSAGEEPNQEGAGVKS